MKINDSCPKLPERGLSIGLSVFIKLKSVRLFGEREGGKYEFRIKAYVALVDSYVFAEISEIEVRLKRASRKKDPISRNTIELTIDYAEKKKS